MNPYPRAESGSYKSLFIEGLEEIGETELANEFKNGNMKLAIVSSIYGSVKTFSNLTNVMVNALNKLNQTDTVKYYSWGLTNNQFVVASSNVGFIYNPMDKKAVELNERLKQQNESEIINPYFTT